MSPSRNRQRTQKGGRKKRSSRWQKGGTKKRPNQKNKKSCHPAVIGKQVAPDTCMTDGLIRKIMEKYNAHAALNEKITDTDPRLVYDQLKSRGHGEDWLEEILRNTSSSESKKIKEVLKRLEAPRQPDDWKKNPNEWLSNLDIDSVMKQYKETYPEFLFLKTTPLDFADRRGNDCVTPEICHFHLASFFAMKPGKRKIGLVFNLSDHDEKGSHWVSLYLHFPEANTAVSSESSSTELGGDKLPCKNLDRRHTQLWSDQTPYAFFFDSAGDDTPDKVKDLVCRLSKEWKTMNPGAMELQFDDNHRTHTNHQKGNNECGMYSLFFLVTMLSGYCGGKVSAKTELQDREVCPADMMLNTEQEKREYFQSQGKWNGKSIPDRFVAQFRNLYFTPVDR